MSTANIKIRERSYRILSDLISSHPGALRSNLPYRIGPMGAGNCLCVRICTHTLALTTQPRSYFWFPRMVLRCFVPGRGAKYCDESVCLSVCLFACITRKLHGQFSSNFNACYLWSRIDLSLTALRYAKYFRFRRGRFHDIGPMGTHDVIFRSNSPGGGTSVSSGNY